MFNGRERRLKKQIRIRKKIIIAFGLLSGLTFYAINSRDKSHFKGSPEKTLVTNSSATNKKLTMSAQIFRTNLNIKSLSLTTKKTIPSLDKDTIYGKINFSANSKMNKSDFLIIVNDYKNKIKKIGDEGFYGKGLSSTTMIDSNEKNTLYCEYNYIKIINDNIKCLLRVHIVFDGRPPVKDGDALKVLDIKIQSEEQKPQFNPTEKENILRDLKEFLSDVPPPPPTK